MDGCGEEALTLLLKKGFKVEIFIHDDRECLALFDLYPRIEGRVKAKHSLALRTLETEIRSARADAIALARLAVLDVSAKEALGKDEPTSYCEAWVEALVCEYYAALEEEEGYNSERSNDTGGGSEVGDEEEERDAMDAQRLNVRKEELAFNEVKHIKEHAAFFVAQQTRAAWTASTSPVVPVKYLVHMT